MSSGFVEGRGWGAAIMLALALAAGCAEEKNQAPELGPLQDATFQVNQSSQIQLFADDADDDPREFTFTIEPAPPTQTQGSAGRPAVMRIGPGQAIFSWTPGVADAGPTDTLRYQVTFTVADGRGGQDQETITVTVVNSGVTNADLVFLEPAGAGIAINLAQSPCVDNLPVKVKADLIPTQEVQVDLAAPLPEGAYLSPPGPGKDKLFNWCPPEGLLDQSLTHTISFRAGRIGTEETITKRFTVLFRRNAGAGCPGAAPGIDHTPPGSFAGPLNYDIEATITDDLGFKSPPVLAFSADEAIDPTGPIDTSGWQTVDFRSQGSDRWVAAVPNLQLADGERRTVYYTVIATDNDDSEGTRCDHTTESEVFSFVATGGGSAGGRTYGFCEPCVSDDQCGGEGDFCVPLRGETFCGRGCEEGACAAGESCLELTSVGGVQGYQCVPADLNCGQLCVTDALDGAGGNDEEASASPVEDGAYPALSICDEDADVFRVPVVEGQSVSVRIDFTNARGDLDLFMKLPGYDDYDYQSANGDTDGEEVTEPCVDAAGDALIVVNGYQGARNTYDMRVTIGPGECDRVCTDDELEAGLGNDSLNEFVVVEAFPFFAPGLQICREDGDFYGFEAEAGELISASAEFSHREGDLDLRLFRSSGQEVGSSLSYRDIELIEAAAPVTDIYVLQVFGATRSVANSYDLSIDKRGQVACEVTLECPRNQYCRDGFCVDATCGGGVTCGPDAQCIAPRTGLAAPAGGGICADYCASAFSCRDDLGYACKRFVEFFSACAPVGAGGSGDRCASFADCAENLVCLGLAGGYCAAGDCADDARVCPDDAVCASLGGDSSACMKRCAGDEDCRAADGYTCQDTGNGERACLP